MRNRIFFPKLKYLSFLHCACLRVVHVDKKFFSESENSALSWDVKGPKSNFELHVAADATINHVKKRQSSEKIKFVQIPQFLTMFIIML